ncbi:MAG: imidazole glycerol phosphate synthase subunit HisH [Planctomycetales bacterium]|nr:imidazole glycerol phosphate synthase subunit HisH [Planctomycetales bacterium]
MLVIIDYGVGNVRSVTNAFRYIGSEIAVSCDPTVIRRARGLILPGVGASGYAMQKVAPIAGVIKEQAAAGKPLLGICVGFQLLFDESHEMGTHKCLGLIKGNVIPIPTDSGLTIPHMGWNYVRFAEGMRLFDGLGEGRHFAFANSFYAQVDDAQTQAAYTEYGVQITAAVEKGNIYGCQFHPEKSAADGLQVLKNFVTICHEATK